MKDQKTGSSWKWKILKNLIQNKLRNNVFLWRSGENEQKGAIYFFKMTVWSSVLLQFWKGSKLQRVRVSEEALATFDFANVIFHLQVIKATWKRSIDYEHGKRHADSPERISPPRVRRDRPGTFGRTDWSRSIFRPMANPRPYYSTVMHILWWI